MRSSKDVPDTGILFNVKYLHLLILLGNLIRKKLS